MGERAFFFQAPLQEEYRGMTVRALPKTVKMYSPAFAGNTVAIFLLKTESAKRKLQFKCTQDKIVVLRVHISMPMKLLKCIRRFLISLRKQKKKLDGKFSLPVLTPNPPQQGSPVLDKHKGGAEAASCESSAGDPAHSLVICASTHEGAASRDEQGHAAAAARFLPACACGRGSGLSGSSSDSHQRDDVHTLTLLKAG
ncbi:hypothetical protein Anapl_01580 [Anas platyrhynchos]|uniref:Uncharacterized protein n=1 Tax=Anas platyrhynchos TaxID=8839 RepID=R0JYN9_ANAPL|nr:hypothetical protein Anapl_01580 [Anas platyrhynchos]